MDVRTFEAFTLRDAIKCVKTEYGKDAVILNTREKANPNGQKIYEVTAAAPAQSRGLNSIPSSSIENFDLVRGLIGGVETRLQDISESMISKEHLGNIAAGMHELKFLLVENLRKKESSAYQDLAEPIAAIVRQLQIMGIDATRVKELIKFLEALPATPKSEAEGDALTDYYKAQAVRWMLKRIRIAPRWDVMSGTVGAHCFVGPTGVGKSSIVAKLAANFHLKDKKNVLVVSMDNQRLAASEQMRVYCKILGVPFEFVPEAASLAPAIARHSDLDMVFIDSSGVSPKSDKGVDHLLELKSCTIPVDFHLVLSITEKEDQMDRSVRCFSKLGLKSVLFNKLDETWTYGDIFNIASRWSLNLSYFGIGQSIPEDLERASRERVVERIFGL